MEQLLETYSNLVFSICFGLIGNYFDAQDLTQETFLSVYKNLSRFDGKQEKAWICRIATNKCLDYIKSAKRHSILMDTDYFDNSYSPNIQPEDYILETEVRNELYSLCDKLKEPYRSVALDYFYYEIDITTMAVNRKKNIKTLQTQIYRAKAMLKKLWRKEGRGYEMG